MDERPIGVFDSGVGGLSILLEIRRLMPAESAVYYADNAYCPYGVKPPADIRRRTFAIADLLLSHGAKALIVACNTASIVALDAIRGRLSGQGARVPVVGIEPGVKPAVEATRNGTIGVLATSVALSGERFSDLVRRYGSDVRVVTQPAPGLVELVEAGMLNGPGVVSLVATYVKPLVAAGADTIVLGCTHYPFLRPVIQELAGPDVLVIDTGAAVARQTARLLDAGGLRTEPSAAASFTFLTSGHVSTVEPVMRSLWGDQGMVVVAQHLTS